eukprot:758552-Rhodomonas_salina.1
MSACLSGVRPASLLARGERQGPLLRPLKLTRFGYARSDPRVGSGCERHVQPHVRDASARASQHCTRYSPSCATQATCALLRLLVCTPQASRVLLGVHSSG